MLHTVPSSSVPRTGLIPVLPFPLSWTDCDLQRLCAVAGESVARKHPWMWSLTTPTFCMNAYTLVGPTKRYPCDFNCFANASACGVDLGRSASDRGARLRVIS